MIKTFADRPTKALYETSRAKKFPPGVSKRAARKLEYVDLATTLDDLRNPPGNRLHALEGDRKGKHSISIIDQWRIFFQQTQINDIARLLNGRPRQTLDWQTPEEVMAQEIRQFRQRGALDS